MAARRTTPPDEVLRRLYSQGMSLREMRDWGLANGYEADTVQAYSRAARAAGLVMRGRDRLLPWEVSAPHSKKREYRMLQALAKKQRGGSLSPKVERELEAFLFDLERGGFVVGYRQGTPKGFYLIRKDTVPASRTHPTLPVLV